MNYSFKQFLMEAAVGAPLKIVGHGNDAATLTTLFDTHCSDAEWMIERNTPLYRGVRNDVYDDITTVDPTQTERKSENTSNYYTLIFDNLPERAKWPKRSKSLIATTRLRVAEDYGTARVVIPFNRVKIGCINSDDMFDTRLNLTNGANIEPINQLWRALGLSAFDWNDWIAFDKLPAEELESRYDQVIAKQGDVYYFSRKQAAALFDVLRQDGFLRGVQRLYSNANLQPHHSVVTTKRGLAQAHGEVWVGGPCIMVSRHLWEKWRSSLT